MCNNINILSHKSTHMGKRTRKLVTVGTMRHIKMLEIVLQMVLSNIDMTAENVYQTMLKHKENLAKEGIEYTVIPKCTMYDWLSFKKFKDWINAEVLLFLEKRMPITIKKALMVNKAYDMAMAGDHKWASIFCKITGMDVEHNTYIHSDGNVNIDNRQQTINALPKALEEVRQDLLTYREDNKDVD